MPIGGLYSDSFAKLQSNPNCQAFGCESNLHHMESLKKGGELSPYNLQEAYTTALSRIGGLRRTGNPKRHIPIFQRDSSGTRKQAAKDAASALSALWKVAESSKR